MRASSVGARTSASVSASPRSARVSSSSTASSKWSSMARLVRPVTTSRSVRPAAAASSTTYWMAGLSTTGSISFGVALVAGRNRVPSPAAGMTALVRARSTVMSRTLTRTGHTAGVSTLDGSRDKAVRRALARQRRRSAVLGADAGPALAERLLALPEVAAAGCVAAYSSFGTEPPTEALLEALRARRQAGAAAGGARRPRPGLGRVRRPAVARLHAARHGRAGRPAAGRRRDRAPPTSSSCPRSPSPATGSASARAAARTTARSPGRARAPWWWRCSGTASCTTPATCPSSRTTAPSTPWSRPTATTRL